MLDTKKVLFNSIIPPNKAESLPGLGDLDFYKYIKESSKESLLDKIILILESKSEELFSSNLKDLGENDLKDSKKLNFQEFQRFQQLSIARCDYYYTNVTVREKLSSQLSLHSQMEILLKRLIFLFSSRCIIKVKFTDKNY